MTIIPRVVVYFLSSSSSCDYRRQLQTHYDWHRQNGRPFSSSRNHFDDSIKAVEKPQPRRKNKREEFPALLLCVCADGVRLDRNRNEAIGQRHYVYTSDGGGGLSHSIHPIEMRFYSLFSLLPSVMYCSADCHFCFAHQFSVLWAHQGAVLPLQIDGRKEEKNTRGAHAGCVLCNLATPR